MERSNPLTEPHFLATWQVNLSTIIYLTIEPQETYLIRYGQVIDPQVLLLIQNRAQICSCGPWVSLHTIISSSSETDGKHGCWLFRHIDRLTINPGSLEGWWPSEQDRRQTYLHYPTHVNIFTGRSSLHASRLSLPRDGLDATIRDVRALPYLTGMFTSHACLVIKAQETHFTNPYLHYYHL